LGYNSAFLSAAWTAAALVSDITARASDAKTFMLISYQVLMITLAADETTTVFNQAFL
jgi:hypothetical protein